MNAMDMIRRPSRPEDIMRAIEEARAETEPYRRIAIDAMALSPGPRILRYADGRLEIEPVVYPEWIQSAMDRYAEAWKDALARRGLELGP